MARIWIVPGYRRRRRMLMSSAAYAIFIMPWLIKPAFSVRFE